MDMIGTVRTLALKRRYNSLHFQFAQWTHVTSIFFFLAIARIARQFGIIRVFISGFAATVPKDKAASIWLLLYLQELLNHEDIQGCVIQCTCIHIFGHGPRQVVCRNVVRCRRNNATLLLSPL